MPYIGAKELKASDIRRFDVTSSTSATHTLTWTPPTEQSLIVTINGIKQHEDAYSVSGTTLTLSSPLVATDKLEVIGINDIGTTITPAQNSVGLDKLATTGTPSSSTFLRGDMAWTAVSDVSGLSSMQVFTSSGTWTRPAGITKVMVEVQGAGGGGGSADNYNSQGGGAGGYAKKLLDVSSISSATITIGSGGAGGTASPITSGSSGGNSSWSDGTNTITANGGGGGQYADGGGASRSVNGGSASGGDINLDGKFGEWTLGGDSFYGYGARNWVANTTASDNAINYGSGGCGPANTVSGTNYAGSPGRDGIVIVTEYK